MNVRDIIYAELRNRGCELREEVGILYAITPDGEVWDFTVPERNTKTSVDELRRSAVSAK